MKKWKIISMLFAAAIVLLLGSTVMAYDISNGFYYEIANQEACIYVLPNTEVVTIAKSITHTSAIDKILFIWNSPFC